MTSYYKSKQNESGIVDGPAFEAGGEEGEQR